MKVLKRVFTVKMIVMFLALSLGLSLVPQVANAATVEVITKVVTTEQPTTLRLNGVETKACSMPERSYDHNGSVSLQLATIDENFSMLKATISTKLVQKQNYRLQLIDFTVDEAGEVIGCSTFPEDIIAGTNKSWRTTMVKYNWMVGSGEHYMALRLTNFNDDRDGVTTKMFRVTIA